MPHVMDEHSLQVLRERAGDEYLGRRLRAQVDWSVRFTGMGRGGLHYENLDAFVRLVGGLLRVTGLARLGRRNALALTVRENEVAVRGLPAAFEGLRVLHLSDLHLDGHEGFGAHIARALSGVAFDVCAVTGDFRFLEVGAYDHIHAELEALAPALACPFGTWGVMGNHDFIEMVPMLEQSGIRMLLNEAVALASERERLWLVGLEDPHFYGLHDFDKGLRGVPAEGARVLLIHSPEVIPEASARGFGLYLSGHTHGGQICLPGGWAPLVNARCARRYIAGGWRVDGMAGYTSAGVGASGVFARFFCPPEIVVHRLVRFAES
jgi:predicted MPP superfamily phosphohydrolase